jgi:AcrR family transcriptional regulator
VSKSREVLRAAVRLFAARGYAATGIRDLGREAGLNSATLYHYTSGKEELLESVMRGCTSELIAAAKRAVQGSDDPKVQLARLVRAHVGLSAVNPLTARVTDHELRALSPAKGAEMLALRDEYEAIFGQVLRRGARAGQFRVADLHVTRLALLEMCNGVANWYRPDGRLGVGAVQDHFVEIASRAVGVEPLEAADIGPREEPVRLLSEPTVQQHTSGKAL